MKRQTALSLALLFGGGQLVVPLMNPTTVAAAEAKEMQLVKQFNELKALWNDANVTATTVKEKYEATLQKSVATTYPEIAEKINVVLTAAVSGQMTMGQAKQAIDKGLQWYFYGEITRLTKSVPDLLKANKTAEANAALTEALYYYNEVTVNTMVKRDSSYKTTMKDTMETVVIPALKQAVKDGNVTNYNVTRQMFDKTIMKTYLLATMTYVEKIAVETDSAKLKEMFTEAYFLYAPIAASLKGAAKTEGEFVETSFASANKQQFNATAVKAALLTCIAAKMTGYYDKTLKSIDAKDLASAQVTAMEGNMFLAMAEFLLKEKQGVDAYKTLEAIAPQYFNAVVAGDKAKATTLGQQLVQGVSFKYDVTAQQKQLKAIADIKAVFAKEKVDVQEALTLYNTTLQPAVKSGYAAIDQQVTGVATAAIAGQMTVGQAKQAFDKGMQWFVYEETKRLTKSVAPLLKEKKQAEAATAVEQAIVLYEGALLATAEKRDATYGTTLKDTMVTVVLPELRKAVQANDVTAFEVTRQLFDKTIMKTNVLAVLTYADKIAAEKDAVKVKEQLTEAYFLYAPIAASLKGGHEKAATAIEAAFLSGQQANVNVATVKQQFIQALTGKATGYYTKTLAHLAAKDHHAAQVSAMEGNLFIAAQETLLSETLTKDGYKNVLAQAQSYYDAVRANNSAVAAAKGFAVVETLLAKDGIHFTKQAVKIKGQVAKGSKGTIVQGKQTVVPVSTLAKLFNVKATTNAKKKQIVVTNGEAKWTLTHGKQGFIVKNEAYVTVQWLQATLKANVFAHNGTIIVTK